MVDMDEAIPTQDQTETSVVPPEPAPPINSRFLFVDVAALRAKQLRRGARLRFEFEQPAPALHKPERLAMEEVRRGLVWYDIPARKAREEAGA
jgi:DNA-directed RNA polymerase subunit K/omega